MTGGNQGRVHQCRRLQLLVLSNNMVLTNASIIQQTCMIFIMPTGQTLDTGYFILFLNRESQCQKHSFNSLLPHNKQVNAAIMVQIHLLIIDCICAKSQPIFTRLTHHASPNIKRLQMIKNWISAIYTVQ